MIEGVVILATLGMALKRGYDSTGGANMATSIPIEVSLMAGSMHQLIEIYQYTKRRR